MLPKEVKQNELSCCGSSARREMLAMGSELRESVVSAGIWMNLDSRTLPSDEPWFNFTVAGEFGWLICVF